MASSDLGIGLKPSFSSFGVIGHRLGSSRCRFCENRVSPIFISHLYGLVDHHRVSLRWGHLPLSLEATLGTAVSTSMERKKKKNKEHKWGGRVRFKRKREGREPSLSSLSILLILHNYPSLLFLSPLTPL